MANRTVTQPTMDSFLRRAILATDGTVSRLIEEFVEPIRIEKLAECELPPGRVEGWPELGDGARVLGREALICGARSGRPFLHAESLIVLDRLDETLRRELLETHKPIGKLLREHRRETFREFVERRCEPAGRYAEALSCDPAQRLVVRTYQIHLGGRPAIRITERFPGVDGDLAASRANGECGSTDV